ncbi:hypothetical protein HDU98_000779 [Podochytrium sp. JEL0797]|nr:hypothetical protein HDU98_000779 [Podochytrium sp. JEL0797]
MLATISTRSLTTTVPHILTLATRSLRIAPQVAARIASRSYSAASTARTLPPRTATYSTFSTIRYEHDLFIDQLRSNYHSKIVKLAAARGALEASVDHIASKEATAEAAAARREMLLR